MAVNEHPVDGASPEDARIAALYRSASAEEPPQRFEAIIHAAAVSETRKAASPSSPRWWEAWRLPFAFAAVAVLSVSVVMLIHEERGDPLTLTPERSTPPSTESRSGSPAAPEAPIADLARPPVVRDAERGAQSAPVPPTRREAQPEPAKRAATEPSTQATAKQVPAPAAPPETDATTSELRPFRAAPPLVDDARGPAAPPARDAEGAQRGRPLTSPAKPQPMQAPQAAMPAAPSSAPPGPAEASRPAASAWDKRMEKPDASTGASPAVGRLIAELDGLAPSQWIDRIVSLRREGRHADATALLAEFKRRYPEEPLPAGVR